MRVVHLSALDHGGAGTAAHRLHLGLRELGIDSCMVVLRGKHREDPFVYLLEGEQERPDGTVHALDLWSHTLAYWQQIIGPYSDRPPHLEMFTTPDCAVPFLDIPLLEEADVIHMHWVAGILDLENMPQTFMGKPVVWTLHDMNPFTGGCHYAGDCERFKQSCADCPQLGELKGLPDLASESWHRKKKAYATCRMHVVTPSEWLGQCAQESALLGTYPRSVIPNGLPLDAFVPQHADAAFAYFNISREQGAKYLLFGADVVLNRRKGFHPLINAVLILKQRAPNERINLVCFGSMPEEILKQLPFPVISLGVLRGTKALSMAYSLADLFVLPSAEDNLPNTVLESLACGTPVVGFAIGGVPDMVIPGVTGYLAQPLDVQDLATNILKGLKLPQPQARARSRELAEQRYSLSAQAEGYRDLYEAMGKQRRATAGPDKSSGVSQLKIPAGDYASPNLEVILPDQHFPNKIKENRDRSTWPYLRRDVMHNWYVDQRFPDVGFLYRDEAILLYNLAKLFSGKPALEIGCFMGWSACHLALAGVKLDVIDPLLERPLFRDSVVQSLGAAGVLDRCNLYAGFSPSAVEQIFKNIIKLGHFFSLMAITTHQGQNVMLSVALNTLPKTHW